MTGIVNKVGASSGQVGTITSAPGASTAAAQSTQTFTSTGTWTKPSGILWVFVELVGAGGGATGHGEGGGAGGYASEWIDVSSIASEIVTIGTGGIGTTYSANPPGGTATSFGSHLTGGAGGGSYAPTGHRGGNALAVAALNVYISS
jgi:hypothetical protein